MWQKRREKHACGRLYIEHTKYVYVDDGLVYSQLHIDFGPIA